MFKEISFEEALRRKPEVIIEGKKINIKDMKHKRRINNINSKMPMSFERINETLKDVFSCEQYIEFWNGVKIYRIIGV